jgi:cystathionine beta-lyase/cystathionine gamma-synthase
MVKPFPSKTHIGNHMLHPETLMLNYGYDPQLSEGAVKPPVFLTSTFVFKTAEEVVDHTRNSASAFRDGACGCRRAPTRAVVGVADERRNPIYFIRCQRRRD